MALHEQELPERASPLVRELWDLLNQMPPMEAILWLRCFQKKMELKLPSYGKRFDDRESPPC